MELNKFVGKNKDEVLSEALKSLNLTEDDVIVSSTETKKGLFKSLEYELTITPLTDVLEYVKNYLSTLFKDMGLEVSFETQIREKQLKIKMHSDDNALLIGHNGKNLAALQTIIRQAVKVKFGTCPYISLDVENYKDKQIMYLKKTARRIAKEVMHTKVPVELENMNSYERLIVHQAITDFKNISSESVGEEPNRHIVIKYKENNDDTESDEID